MNRTKPHRLARALPCAAALLLTLSAFAAPAPARAEEVWVDGYRLGVTLRPLREVHVLGEPVPLKINFENHADTALELMLSGERDGAGWPDDFEVTVVGPDGERLARPAREERGEAYTYTNSFVRAVHAGERSIVSAGIGFNVDHWAKIVRPGVYTVHLRRGLRVGPYRGTYELFPDTTKPAVELRLTTRFTVTEGGEERTGRLVEELGARMLECDPSSSVEAATRLSSLKDGRALKYFSESLGKCKNTSIRYTALGAFAVLDTDAAFEGLRAAARDPDEDFRTAAATFVTKSEHREARALLLSLRRDSYYGVRFVVLGALEAWDTAQARKLIWEMTNDEHPLVREEALRFLQERAAHPPRREH